METDVIIEREIRAPWADRKAPLLARLIALGRSIYWEGWRMTSIRAPYGEVSFGAIMFALSLGSYGHPHLHVAVPGIQVFFRLPRWRILERLTRGPNDMERRGYGFSCRFGHDWQGDIHWQWGKRSGIRSMPWGWNKRKGDYRREYLAVDGNWCSHDVYPYEWRKDDGGDGPEAAKVAQPYPYLTRGGEFQGDITATAHMERTQLVYRVFGIVIKRMTKHSIDVTFDKEVGNQRGSWKGGVLGTGYDMQPGESIEQTLHRMRRDRDFCR
jgi:hypothetical protein